MFIRHKDQPGAIGRVGTLLATEGINIAAMQVGRSEAGGDAIMTLSIDKHVEDSGIELLKGLEDIYERYSSSTHNIEERPPLWGPFILEKSS